MEELDVKQFNTKNISIFALDDLDKNFEEDVRQKLDREMSDFEQKGSGWSLQSILHLTVNINKFNSLRTGCHIALPTTISNKHACINIKNNDKQCFKYAVLAGIHNIRKDAQIISKYKDLENSLNFDGIDFPVKLKDIPKFERQNDVSVNLYILKRYGEKYDVSPLHLTACDQDKHVDLLFLQDYFTLMKIVLKISKRIA